MGLLFWLGPELWTRACLLNLRVDSWVDDELNEEDHALITTRLNSICIPIGRISYYISFPFINTASNVLFSIIFTYVSLCFTISTPRCTYTYCSSLLLSEFIRMLLILVVDNFVIVSSNMTHCVARNMKRINWHTTIFHDKY